MKLRTLSLSFLFLLFFMAVPEVDDALAQDGNCINILTQADDLRRRGRFNEAIQLLDRCKDSSSLGVRDRARAYEIIAQSYEGLVAEDDAKNAIRRLLELAPDYELDPDIHTPTYMQLVNEVKQENANVEPVPDPTPAKKSNKKRLALFGGGAAVAAAAIIIIVSGGDDDDGPGSLSGPPRLPQ